MKTVDQKNQVIDDWVSTHLSEIPAPLQLAQLAAVWSQYSFTELLHWSYVLDLPEPEGAFLTDLKARKPQAFHRLAEITYQRLLLREQTRKFNR